MKLPHGFRKGCDRKSLQHTDATECDGHTSPAPARCDQPTRRRRGPPFRLTPQDERCIAAAYRRGLSSRELARLYGVSSITILAIVRRNGGTPRPTNWVGRGRT